MTMQRTRTPRSAGRRLATVLGALLVVLIAGFVATLAIPVGEWRSGDQGLTPLALHAPRPMPQIQRLWIDTDAACGASRRTDPDDCLALAALLQSMRFDVVGVSTTFGNAALPVVDATVDALLAQARANGGQSVPHYSGASAAMSAGSPRDSAASTALAQALEDGPLVVLALGPLTNVAEALRARPELAPRVARLVAVMGRRPGHLFHPAAGVAAHSFLGHGPVMRDFNFALDGHAVAAVLKTRVALTLVPYDAATGVELTAADLDRLGAAGGPMRWATERSRQWLQYWTEDIGRRGFFPFDLLAAGFLLAPSRYGCAEVGAFVGEDTRLFAPLFRPQGLLVTTGPSTATAEYCASANTSIITTLIALLHSGRQ